MKFLSGSGQGTFLGYVNSFVHCCMYLYYSMTSFKPEMKHSLWWKKHITQLQLTQLAILAIHFSVPLFTGCNQTPKFYLLICALQNAFMFLLFADFYYKAYIVKNRKVINKKA